MSDDLLQGSQKEEVTVSQATDEDIASFMRGENDTYAPGGRFDSEDRGMGSGIGEANYQEPPLKERLDEPEYRQTRAESQQQQQSQAQQEQDFKKLYGQSENEKGELRKATSELLAELNKAKEEMANMRAAGWGQQPGQQNYNQPVPPQQPQRVDWSKVDFFQGREPDEAPTIDELNHMFRLTAQTMEELQLQQGQLSLQQIQAQKAAAGITPLVEQQLYQANPWLATIPDNQRHAALMGLKQTLDQQQAQARAQQHQAQPQPVQQQPPQVTQPVVQRPLYVESGTGRTTGETQVPVEQRLQQELAEAKAKGGSRAMAEVLRRYGVGKVNDWGPEYLI